MNYLYVVITLRVGEIQQEWFHCKFSPNKTPSLTRACLSLDYDSRRPSHNVEISIQFLSLQNIEPNKLRLAQSMDADK